MKFFTSNIVNYEATNTPDKAKRNTLVADHKAREKVAQDEKLLGFDSYGDRLTWISSPRISDVQRETARRNNEARHKAGRCKAPHASGL